MQPYIGGIPASIKISEKRVLFCGKELKRISMIPYGTGKRNAFSSGGKLRDWSV